MKIFFTGRKLNLFFAVFSFLLTGILSAQTDSNFFDLSSRQSNWQAVVGGECVAPIIETQYGFVIVSDGRMLSACSNSGNILWQKSLKGKTTDFISSFDDFLYVVTGNDSAADTLNFFNSSGTQLWSEKIPFDVTQIPSVGFDGRVFLHGKKNIACYGFNGVKKWECDTPELANLPVFILDDGSFLVFTTEVKNNGSVAKHFSAFGETLEDITFSGILETAVSCAEGVIVSLKNGSVGLVCQKNDSADSRWVRSTEFKNGAGLILYSEDSKTILFGFQAKKSIEFITLNSSDGTFINKFSMKNLDFAKLKFSRVTDSGYFISDGNFAIEFDKSGAEIWQAKLPKKNTWNYLSYSDDNFLILGRKNWVLDAWRLFQVPQVTKNSLNTPKKTYVKSKKMLFSPSDNDLFLINDSNIDDYFSYLKNGDYGTHEKEIISSIKSVANAYKNDLTSIQKNFHKGISFFQSNPVYTQNLMKLMSETGTDDFDTMFASLIKLEFDANILSCMINAAGNFSYDPTGSMLDSIEFALLNRISKHDSDCLKDICDATYKICRFMGKPALNRKGKDILTHLFYPQYDKTVRDYARTTLSKLVDLERVM